MEEEEARHTHYYPFPMLHLLPSFRELPKQTTEARRGEKRTEPHALHCTALMINLKGKTKNKQKTFMWLLFSSPALLPSYLLAYVSIYLGVYIYIYLCPKFN
jgi:hypothetical protein